MKVIIAGGREFKDFTIIKKYCDIFLKDEIDIKIVSGGASGADYLGQLYAIGYEYEIKTFPANWFKYGKSAGPRRNKEMAEYADMLIAFWDGESKGTKNMIKTAKEKGLLVNVIIYEKVKGFTKSHGQLCRENDF